MSAVAQRGDETAPDGLEKGSLTMCISAEALALFLNIIGVDLVSTEPGRVIVHATEGDVAYVAHEGKWCTMGPQLDRRARFDALKAQ